MSDSFTLNGVEYRRYRDSPIFVTKTGECFLLKRVGRLNNTRRYPTVKTRTDGVKHGSAIHRIVWEAFNGSIPAGHHIHHKDGNINNFALDNLELVSSPHHTVIHMAGEKSVNTTLTNQQALDIRGLRAQGWRLRDLADEYGVTMKVVRRICNGESWKSITGGNPIPVKDHLGSRHVESVLDEDKVRQIRSLRAQGMGTDEIARQFGTVPSNIRKIVRRASWKHVKENDDD